MTMKKSAFSLPITAGVLSLVAATGLACAIAVAQQPLQPRPGSFSPQAPGRAAAPSNPEDDFAGLDYSDEQKAAIDKIHQEAKAHRDTILKDTALTVDQRDAMLTGYTRIEYGQIYRALTPAQKKVVQHRIAEHRLAEQKARQKQGAPK